MTTFLLFSLVVSLLTAFDDARAADLPPSASLQAGDFLWPKLPDKIVPYDSEPGEATATKQAQWEKDRVVELTRLEHLLKPTDEEKERYSALSVMTYQEFLSTYLTDQPPGTPMPFGAIGPVATGHVAIVDIRDGEPWIIEAMLKDGVRMLTYNDWLAGRPGEKVWHGRLTTATEQQRKQIALNAKSQVGKPYDFWNFDLSDERGFYCSKLAWLSVWKATGVALDGTTKTKRALWYSPKQMLHSKALTVVFSPGDY